MASALTEVPFSDKSKYSNTHIPQVKPFPKASVFAEVQDEKEFETSPNVIQVDARPIISNGLPPQKRRKLTPSFSNEIKSKDTPPKPTSPVLPTSTPVSTPASQSPPPSTPVFEFDDEVYTEQLKTLSDEDLFKQYMDIRRALGEVEEHEAPPINEFAHISTEDLQKEVEESEEWLRATETPTQLYCVCQQPYTDGGPAMIACEGCSGWFHLECMGLDEKIIEGIEDWFCPRCEQNENMQNSDDDSSDGEQTGFEDKSFEELVEMIIHAKTNLCKEKSERLLKEKEDALEKIALREKHINAELEQIKSEASVKIKKLENQVSSLTKKEKKLTEENRKLHRKAINPAESESMMIKQLQEKLKETEEELTESRQQSRDKSKQVHLLTLQISELDKERGAFEDRLIEIQQQRDAYRKQVEQLLNQYEECANGHPIENNTNGKNLQKVAGWKNLELSVRERRNSFEEKTSQFKIEDEEFAKQRVYLSRHRQKYAEDFKSVLPLKNGGAKTMELRNKIRKEPKKQKEILQQHKMSAITFFDTISQTALSDDEPIQLIRPPRSNVKRKRTTQSDKGRPTKRMKKDSGEKKGKRKRTKSSKKKGEVKKEAVKKEDEEDTKPKNERKGKIPTPAGDGNEDVCRVCGKGQDDAFKLFCCDGCSAVYHRRCTRMKKGGAHDELSRFPKSWLDHLEHWYCNLCRPEKFHVPIQKKRTKELIPEKDWPLLIDRDKYLQQHKDCEIAFDLTGKM